MEWPDGKVRCSWANPKNERYIRYHDEVWGVPVHDDQKLFEMLILECFQAGLSWECVLNKQEAFRRAFDGFDLEQVCAMADTFLRNAAGAVQRIGECTEPRQAAGQEGRLLISTGEAPIEKTFAAGAITPLGKTALNNLRSVFEDYSDTLSPDEQLAIIAQLISEILR